MAGKQEEKEIVIPEIHREEVIIRLVGDSPLLVHKWSEKAKKMILDKQTQRAKTKAHDIREPFRDFIDSLYWISGEPAEDEKNEEGWLRAIESGECRFGFPAVAFKSAAIDGAYRHGAIPNKVGSRAAFVVLPADLAEIRCGHPPVMREDTVTVGNGMPDLRYRACFMDWYVDLTVNYDPGMISLEQLLNIFNIGGSSCGIGEWRIEKGGNFGMFHVE